MLLEILRQYFVPAQSECLRSWWQVEDEKFQQDTLVTLMTSHSPKHFSFMLQLAQAKTSLTFSLIVVILLKSKI